MATRNILHISKLQEFEDFLETKGYMIVATSKNPFEVLRAQKDGDTVIVYQKKDTKEHLSTMDKDYHLVREFIKRQRVQTNADRIRSMTDEELAEFLAKTVWRMGENIFSCKNSSLYPECLDGMCEKCPCYLDWLKSPAERGRIKDEQRNLI